MLIKKYEIKSVIIFSKGLDKREFIVNIYVIIFVDLWKFVNCNFVIFN